MSGGAWHQRIAATLFHQGVPVTGSMATPEGRAAAEHMNLSPAGQQAVQAGLRQIDRLTAELDVLRRQLGMLSRRQPGCRALRPAWFGIGPVTAVAIRAELGDVRRFGNSGAAVRHTGLDITVYSSDAKRAAGHLSRQGPPLLRWALYESAKCAARPAAPRPRLLHRGPGPAHRRAGHLAGGPQARPPLLPHAARTRRGGAGPPPRDLAAPHRRRARHADDPRPAPATSLLPGAALGQPPKNERPHHPHPGHPITHHVAGARQNAPRTEIRPGARRGRSHRTQPVCPQPTGGASR